MIRFLFAVIALLCLTVPAHAEVRVSVGYSEAADLYSTMDNVSEWLAGFTIPAYRKEWEQRFGWSESDQHWIDRYAAYRQRTFLEDNGSPDPRTLPDGIVASRSENTAGTDPLATYLLAQPDIDTAMRNLDRALSPDDARMLRAFYRHFEPKWRVLLGESAPLKARANDLQARLDGQGVAAFVARVNAFFRSDVDGPFTVYFTRHPRGKGSSAEPLAGAFMLLHAPVEETNTEYWDTIVIHELVHYVSSHQPQEQKQALTARFLDRCALPEKAKRLWLFEEPLAVAWGQAAYSAKILGTPLDPNDNWYAVPWVDIVSRTIAPSIIDGYANEMHIEDVLDQTADRCNNLMNVANQLNR